MTGCVCQNMEHIPAKNMWRNNRRRLRRRTTSMENDPPRCCGVHGGDVRSLRPPAHLLLLLLRCWYTSPSCMCVCAFLGQYKGTICPDMDGCLRKLAIVWKVVPTINGFDSWWPEFLESNGFDITFLERIESC